MKIQSRGLDNNYITKCTPNTHGVIFTVSARVELKPYSNRGISVVKAKYDLKDKSEALNKFIELYGKEEVEPEVKESYVKKILTLEKNYFKKNKGSFARSSVEKLRKEIEGMKPSRGRLAANLQL